MLIACKFFYFILLVILYLAYRPVYKMVLGGFLILFLSMGTWTWKITEVLFRHRVSYDVIAKSNMADVGHYENPNFLGFRSTCKCNTTFSTDFCMRNSLPTLFWPLVAILTFKLHILACKVWPHCCYTTYVNLYTHRSSNL